MIHLAHFERNGISCSTTPIFFLFNLKAKERKQNTFQLYSWIWYQSLWVKNMHTKLSKQTTKKYTKCMWNIHCVYNGMKPISSVQTVKRLCRKLKAKHNILQNGMYELSSWFCVFGLFCLLLIQVERKIWTDQKKGTREMHADKLKNKQICLKMVEQKKQKKSWQKTAATATAPPPPTKWVWEQAIRPYHPISQIKTQSAANFNEKKRKK